VNTSASDNCGDTTNCSFTVTVNSAGGSVPVLSIRSAGYPRFELSWTEDLPGSALPTDPPGFGLQVLTGDSLSGTGVWSVFNNGFIRRINQQLLAGDVMTGGAFYRLNNTVTNPLFLPSAITLAANQVTSTGATLNGNATPAGIDTVYWFAYGVDTNYGQTTPAISLATSINVAALTYPISGLPPATPCHFQLLVKDDDGLQRGNDQLFITLGPPPVVVTLAASSITPSSAMLNGTINGEGTAIAGYFEYWYFLSVEGGGEWITNRTTQFYGPGNHSVQSFSATVTTLGPITYYYQIVGFNATSEAFGAVTNFIPDY
jgi:hypothetical protein